MRSEGEGILYIVGTPIGNLGDITYRALDILRTVNYIACEDTRVTVKLLNHYQITGLTGRLLSFYEHNQLRRTHEIINYLKSGKTIALVTDSGTPGISDPGGFLVKETVKEQLKIVPIPGACAVTSAISISGLIGNKFVFLGFLDRKPTKIKNTFAQYKGLAISLIFYESPYRIIRTLKVLTEIFPSDTEIIIARELTKMYEQVIRGNLNVIIDKLSQGTVKGEFVVIINPGS